MKSQKHESWKKNGISKKMKTKNFLNLKISELHQCQRQTMSVSDNV